MWLIGQYVLFDYTRVRGRFDTVFCHSFAHVNKEYEFELLYEYSLLREERFRPNPAQTQVILRNDKCLDVFVLSITGTEPNKKKHEVLAYPALH